MLGVVEGRHHELFPSHLSAFLGWKPGLSSPPRPPANKTVNNSPPSGWISCNKVSAHSTALMSTYNTTCPYFYSLTKNKESPQRRLYEWKSTTFFSKNCKIALLFAVFPRAALNTKISHPIFYVHVHLLSLII